MNITILGATGQIGHLLVPLLTAHGHEVTAASRSSGVDAALGSGLDEALHGADVLIDVLNSPSMDDDAALAFFTATSSNLTCAAKRAGIGHHVVLSIVGIDTVPGGGYVQGKVLQENTVAASGLPYTIVRATQFHEFAELITESLIADGKVCAPDALIQPVAADEVAAVIARLATGAPLDGVHDFGGPDKLTFAELAALVLGHQGRTLPVTVDPGATYFGAPVTRDSLVAGDDAERGTMSLATWLSAR